MEEVTSELQQHLRLTISTVTQLVDAVKRQSAWREQSARERIESLSRQAEQEHQRWLNAQREVYKRVGWDDWQNQASLQEWSHAYAVARVMREHDPAAVRACQVAEQQVASRFGVDLRDGVQTEQVADQLRIRQAAASYVEQLADPAWVESATRKDWATMYGAATVMGEVDPKARVAADRAREELATRWDVDIAAASDQVRADFAREQGDPLLTPSAEPERDAAARAENAEHALLHEADVVDAEVVDEVELHAEEHAARLAAQQQPHDMSTALALEAGKRKNTRSNPAGRRPARRTLHRDNGRVR